ncbi:M56 family metallopeptidase [Ferroplasma sp.]|uniref:M56 family metallopeptidase n=1 Tax=Ferroplasma sp. TaxID=2591003 RepID=UPI0026213AE1|nr:M56 family metallopeptidase [Ferroplasma sp.]
MSPEDKKEILRKSALLSNLSLIIIFLVYIILSSIPFSIYTVVVMLAIIIINSMLFMHFKNIMRDQDSDENIFQYITDDMSWRYVTYLSIFFLVMLLAQGYIKLVDQYSYLIILNAFIIFIWGISANNPMVSILIRKSKKLQDIFINNEAAHLSEEMGIKEPEIYIINTNDRIANAFEVNRRESYVFITSYLMNVLDYNEIIGVLAHELSHIKLRHNQKTTFINFIFFIVMINIISLAITSTNPLFFYMTPLFFLILILFIMLVVPAVKRHNEVQADLNALKYVNKEYLIDGLKRISEIDKIPENVMKSLSLDHPSTEKRIQLIENSKS